MATHHSKIHLITLIALTGLTACSEQLPDNNHLPKVAAIAETTPVADTDDAADDPVILVDSTLQKSIIVGTNKRRGLEWYDLSGKILGSIDSGRINNVDATSTAQPGIFLLAGSKRTTLTLDVYRADLSANSVELTKAINTNIEEPYGLCANSELIFIGDKASLIEAYRWPTDGVSQDKAPTLSLQFDSQTEGCVAYPEANQLFVGEENAGIWRVDLSDGSKTLFAGLSAEGLVADVEGIDIYRGETGPVLIASSQGDSSFVVFDLPGGRQLAKFAVDGASAAAIDGSEDTDGLAVYSDALPGFPQGLLVTQDGFNSKPGLEDEYETQNFKVIDWRDVEALLAR